MSYSEWIKKKREEESAKTKTSDAASVTPSKTTSGTTGSSSSGLSYSEWIKKKRETAAQETAQGWAAASDDLLSEVQKYYSNWRGKEDAQYTSYQERISGLLAQADSWRKQYANNNEAISSIDSVVSALDKAKDYAYDYRKYYSQWETEDDYKAYLDQQQDYEEKSKFDLDAGQKEIEDLEAAKKEYESWKVLTGPDVQDKYRQFATEYGSIDDLEALISQKKQYLNQAKHIQEGIALSGAADNDDFKEYRGYVSTHDDSFWSKLTSDYGLGYEDLTYEYINNQNGIRDEIKQKHRIYDKNDDESVYEANGYDYLTESEIAVYNYYYAKDGKEKAQEYLDSIQETLNHRKATSMYGNMEDKTALELAFGVAAGLDQFKSGVKNLLNTDDDYIAQTAHQIASGMVREDLEDVGLKLPEWLGGASLGQVGYDAVTTTANMAPSIMSSLAANMLAPGSGAVVGNAMMFASSTGNAYQEALNMGYDKDQARVYSTLVGASEVGLQYLLGGISSLGGKVSGNVLTKILNGVDNAFARTAIKLGGNMLSEGMEEGLQEILTPWFQNLAMHTDEGINWSEVAYSTLLGALTAGFLEGGSTISGEVKTYKTGRELQKADISAQRLAAIGQTFSADTVAYQLAGRVNENTGAYTMGRLFNEIGATMTEQNVNDITNALVAKGMDKTTAKKNAEALAYVVEGGQLTDRQVAAIEANEVLAEVARATLIDANTTWNQRSQGYNKMLKELANEMTSPKASQAKAAEAGQENVSSGDNVDGQKENSSEDLSEVDTSPAKVGSIANIQKGKATITLEDGSEVDVAKADLDPDDGVRIETIASIDGISVADANFVLNTLRVSPGVSAQMDSLGAKEVFKYGFYGFSMEHIAKHGVFANSLTEAQRQAIYEVGQRARQQQVEKATPKKATVAKNATTGIYLDAGGGNVTAFRVADMKGLTDKQKAGVQAAMVLKKLGIGGNIYFFESYRNSKGQIVYRDANGNEKKAPNGWYSEKDGSIHIDLNAGKEGQGYVLFTIAHELTHFIEQWSPKKYKILADFLVENYEKGQSMDKLVRAKQQKLSLLRGEKVSYSEAYSEVIADSMEAMLADGNVLEKLVELKVKDHELVSKMKQFFDNLVAKIRNIYKGLTPDSAEGNAVLEMKDSIEKLQSLLADALVDASENYQASEQVLAQAGIAVNAETDSGSLLSVRDVLSDSDRKKVAKALADRFKVTEIEAMQWLKAETSLASLILNPKYSMFLDYEADPDELAIKQNSDYPQGTVDFSNICKKRREFTQVMNRILRNFPNHVFAATDLAKIRTIMGEEGMTLPCGICYVEDRRQLDTIVAQDFINGLKLYREGSKTRPDGKPFNANQLKGLQLTDGDTYVPTIYELVSLEGRNSLKAKNPNMEAAWVRYNNARGMQSVRLLTNEAEYKRQILKYNQKTVQSKNDHGGLRIYSFSDMEMFHLIDIIQVITDSAAVGLTLQGYTKVNEYAKAVKDTGEKLNRSLIPKGDLGYHVENGKVVLDYDTVEGIDIYHEDFFDNKDNPNVGNITIGVNDVQIRAAMVSDFVDQIIPFHTGQSEEVLGEKGIAAWDNYKDFQTEKDLSTGKTSSHQVNIYTEVFQAAENEGKPIQNKRQFVEKFLAVCKENGLKPRFAQFLNTDANGDYVYTEGYHKFLVDFKTFAQTEVGEYLPQMPVKPIFNEAYITGLLKAYVKEQQVKDAEVAKQMPRVIQRITDEIIKPAEVKRSDRDFSYQELTAKKPLNGRIIKASRTVQLTSDGSIDRAWVVSEVLKQCETVQTKAPLPTHFVNIPDIGKNVEITGNGIKHGFIKSEAKNGKPVPQKSLINARAALDLPHILQNSIEVNRSERGDNAEVEFSHILIGITAMESSNGTVEYYAVRSVVEARKNQGAILTEANVIGKLHAMNAKKIGKPQAQVSVNGTALASSSLFGYSVTDLLNDVKNEFDDTFSNDVYKHFGMTRKVNDFSKYLKFSDRDSAGNQLSKGQQEFFENSKVRDASGKLMVMYHGTANGGAFTIFDGDKLGNESRTTQIGQGFYFTNMKKEAESYTKNVDIYGRASKGKKPHLHQVYLNITNPFDIHADQLDMERAKAVYMEGTNDHFFDSWIPFYLNKKTVNGKTVTKAAVQAMSKTEKVSAYVDYLSALGIKEVLSNMVRAFPYGKQSELLASMKKQLGYDGIVEEFQPGQYQYVAFAPEQVKATDNQNPTADPDIRYSDRDLSPEQQKNYDYNQKQETVGSTLKTLKGSAIKRSAKYGVGKEIGGEIYFHKDYAEDIIPDEILSQAMQLLEENQPGFEYNCLKYNPKTGVVAFQEAPDFDSAREPVVGDYVSVNTNTGVAKTGHSNYIWHHKWNWVKNDYSGFDVEESWNWSKQWLSTLTEVSDGNGIERWNTQLDKFGLPHDGEDIRYSDRPVEQKHTSAGTSINATKVPSLYTAAHKKGLFEEGGINIDIGAGRFETATDFLKSIGVTSLPFDPFNRTTDVNKKVVDFLMSGEKADTATCSNCLNVIDSAEARANVILEVAKSIKPDGIAIFTVYENKKSLEEGKAGEVAKKPDQWQEFRSTASYVPEIQQFFDDVPAPKGGLIIAKNPKKNLPKAAWQISSKYSAVEPGVDDAVIMYSDRDSDGNSLTAEQRAFFAQSKVRDEQGRLIPMYHGTNTANFTVFDPEKSDDHISLFFTSDPDVANTYTQLQDKGRDVDPYNLITADSSAKQFNAAQKRVGGGLRVVKITPEWIQEMKGKAESTATKLLGVAKKFADLLEYNNSIGIFKYDIERIRDVTCKGVEKLTKDDVMKLKQAMGSGKDHAMFITDHKGAYREISRIYSDTYKRFEEVWNYLTVAATPDSAVGQYTYTETNSSVPFLMDRNLDFLGHIIPGTEKEMVAKALDRMKWVEDHHLGNRYKVYLNITNPYILDAGIDYSGKMDRVSFEKGYHGDGWRVEFENADYDEIKYMTTTDFVTFIESAFDAKTTAKIKAQIELDNDAYVKEFGDLDPDYVTHDIQLRNVNMNYTEPGNWNALNFNGEENARTRDVAAWAKANGYDGVIFKNMKDAGGYAFTKGRGGSTVVTAFSSEQVKSVDNKNPTTDPDIRFSDRDSDGNQLTEDQVEFFENSKARDENGNLYVMYHGSRSPLFTEFDMYEGVWLTPDQRYAEVYAEQWRSWRGDSEDLTGLEESVYADPDYRLYKMYANITNPLDLGEINDEFDRSQMNRLARLLGVPASRIRNISHHDGYQTVGFVYEVTKDHQFIELAKEKGYDGFIASEKGRKTFCAFNAPNQVKLTTNEVPSGFYDIRYSDRDTESVSNRSLLANAFEGAVQNDIEKQRLQEYKGKISLIESEERKLRKLREQIKELSFAKGPKDTKKIRDLQFEANQSANRINTYDKQLLRLEAASPLQNVLNREKELVRKRAEQKGKEALAAYRERVTKTQRDLLEKWQISRQKGIDSRQRTAMRHKIKDVVNELNQYLLKGTKDRHVPIGLQKAVAEALNAVNMDTVGAEERIAKLEQDLLKAKTPEAIQEISRKIDNIREMGDRMDEKLKRLKAAYDEFINSDDPLIANSHDDAVAAHMMRLIVRVGDTPLRDMTIDQLQDVYDVYKVVLATIRNANKSFKDNKNREISTRANQVMAEIDDLGVKRGKRPVFMSWIEKFGWDGLKPVYAMEHIGSRGLTEAYNNVRAGEDTWALDIVEAREFYLEKFKKYRYDSWNFEKKLTFTSTTGKNFELTLDQIMSLYAYSKRDQAADHLKYGGIVYDPKTEVVEKTKSGIKVKYNVANATAYNISEETLADIISKLTPAQKGFVDEMQTYLSDVMGAKGNEVSLAMYDVKLFREKYYFPLKSAHQYMAKAKEQAQGDVKIKNSGFSKETKPHAKNPIVLSSFMDVWTSHVNEMSMYHAFVLPMEDFYRIYNYTTPSKNENMPTEGVNAYIENAYGSGATEYIEQMLKDLNGGARADSRTGVINKMMGLFKKGAVFASLSVVVQQPSAIARAAALVDTKYFIGPKVDHKRHKALWEEVKQYAPVAIIKEMGYFDTNMGKSTQDFIQGKEYSGFSEKMKALVTDSNYRDEILSKAPALADELAWCSIWEAVKRETRAKNPGLDVTSEAFLKKAGERFTEVITKTQVYDSVLARSALMRSKDTGMKMATSFMAEPTTSINMVADALLKGKRGNRKYARTAIGAVIASQILNSILVSFVYAGRDDDEDETYLEKYIGTLTGEILDSLNPAGYIPFIKDIVSIVQGYDVERSDMAVISDLWNAIQSLSKDNVSVYRKVEGFAGSIAQIFGLPVKNIMRDARGIYQTFMSFMNGQQTTKAGIGYAVKGAITGKTVSDQQQLYEALISGDQAQISRVKSRFKNESAINTAIRKALRENDPRIKEAASAKFNGDLDEYLRIAKEILADKHFSQDNVVAAINAEINAMSKGETTTSTQKASGMFNADDFAVAISQGDSAMANAIKTDIIQTAQKNGKTAEEAEKSFKDSAKDSLKEMFLAGDISEQDVISALTAYCGAEENSAQADVQYWAFKQEHPGVYAEDSWFDAYYEKVADSGIGIDVYMEYRGMVADINGEGKKERRMAIIDSLPITSAQKDALYFAEGWAESKLYEAPWR